MHNTQLINIRLTKLSAISTSIKNLSIENIICDSSHLSKYTPNLRRICVTVEYIFENEQLQTIILSITSFETWHMYLNGHEWRSFRECTVVRNCFKDKGSID